MNIRLSILAVLFPWMLTSCSPQAQPTPDSSVATQTYDVSCDEAHRIAAKAIRVRGMRVTEVRRGPSGGTIAGANDRDDLEVHLSCGSGGVRVSASGGHWMEQGVRMSFQNFVERGDRIWPPPKGPKVLVDTYPGVEAKLWFSEAPAGMSVFHLRVVNGGSRPIRVDPTQIRGGEGGRAIAPDVALERAGQPAGGSVFRRTTLGEGEEAKGLVFLPAGDYDSLVVVLVDEETGEGDDFEIFLKR